MVCFSVCPVVWGSVAPVFAGAGMRGTQMGILSEQDQPITCKPATIVTDPEAILAIRDMAILIGYRTWGRTGMLVARNLHPTVRNWNAMTGQKCRTRAEVGEAAAEMIKEIRAARD